MARRVVALALSVGFAAGIYPDGHFDLSTKLTLENYKDVIQKTIDAEKTLMAPAWNAVVQKFKDNEDVEFADVNLSEDSVREGADGTSFNPGMGGWPTIRYFNKETGVGGKPYVQKTKGAMCDELGKEETMIEYVQTAASTSLCSAMTGKGCSDKEADYATKWKAKTPSELKEQFQRLQKMKGSAMKPEAAQWVSQRIAILNQLNKRDEL